MTTKKLIVSLNWNTKQFTINYEENYTYKEYALVVSIEGRQLSCGIGKLSGTIFKFITISCPFNTTQREIPV